MTFDNAPPVGQPDESFINTIGADLRALVKTEMELILIPSAAPENQEAKKQERMKLADQQALDMYKAGRLPLRPDQLERLCQRLGVPVPTQKTTA